jgi:Fe-Mn family superoxide dismutase
LSGLFWTWLSPSGGGEPTGDVAAAIKESFTSFDAFKTQFNQAATTRFGSGLAGAR